MSLTGAERKARYRLRQKGLLAPFVPMTPEQRLEARKPGDARYRASDEGRAAHRRGSARYRVTPKRRPTEERIYARHRLRIAEAKAGGCVDCGAFGDEHGTSETALHFHHVDPSTKLYVVGTMTSYSDVVFWAEVAKCVVVCAPCHRARHRLF